MAKCQVKPIPICVRNASTRVPGARGADKFVGPRGAALMSGDAKGDGWTLQHDVGKHLQWTEFKDHGVQSSMELYGLFGDVFDTLRNANPLRWGVASPHQHHGAVPDIAATFPGERRKLYEVKCMHENPSCYPHCARGGATRVSGRCVCAPCRFRIGGDKRIEKRAGRVNKDVATKLRKLDHSLGGYARGCVGPLEQRLDELGGVTPLVCGAFGGINKAWHHLQKKIAAARAQKVWRELLCPSVSQARGVLLSHMQRRMCFATAGARSRLRHDRINALMYGAGGGPTDYQSRAQANARDTHARSNCAGSRGVHDGWAWNETTGVYH
jgi:hypothetical protein